MSKKLVVLSNDHSTYEVHVESGDPPQKFVGGQSLDKERLKTELYQHGCSEDTVTKAIQDVESGGSVTLTL